MKSNIGPCYLLLTYYLHIVTNMGGGVDTWQPVPINVVTKAPALINLSTVYKVVYT